MAKPKKTLVCTSNASVDGDFIEKGDIREWEGELALRLLSSNRFKEADVAPAPKKKAAPKKAAD